MFFSGTPRSRSRARMCRPRNPAPPVTMMRCDARVGMFTTDRGKGRNSSQPLSRWRHPPTMPDPMPARPRISIVTPSFNQARFLEQTVRSGLDQGYPDLEYIVMDGGSTDGSQDIIRRFAPRLAHWQSAPDGGQGPAILDGWKRATGDLIAWLNSDDVLLAGALDAIASAWRPDRQV